MNTKGLLNQLLSSGQSMLREKSGGGRDASRKPSGAGGASGNLIGDIASKFGGVGGGALGGGALAMLLGNKRLRKFGGKGVALGGAAALGALAYRAYRDWQAQQGASAPAGEPKTIDRVSDSEAEAQSHAILKAMVGAAKADGHIDDRERELIEQEVAKLDGDGELQSWLDAELRKSLDPAEVASAADSTEVASEMYLASRLMVDEESYMERAYLDELVRCLKLDADLRSRLDRELDNAPE